jgi:hypothetical protein
VPPEGLACAHYARDRHEQLLAYLKQQRFDQQPRDGQAVCEPIKLAGLMTQSVAVGPGFANTDGLASATWPAGALGGNPDTTSAST